MNRKEFLEQAAALALLGCSGSIATLIQGCSPVRYIPNTMSGDTIAVQKADFGQEMSALVQNSRLPVPLYLLRLDDGSYSAVLMKCTHKGCQVRPAGDLLVCPCHGSEFSGSGKVLSPPASSDLAAYTVTSDSVTIYIHL